MSKLWSIDQIDFVSEPIIFITNEKIDTTEVQQIINQLKDYLESHKSCPAISAPQLGIKYRIICMRFADGIKSFINPIITKKQDYKIAVETCESMPGKEILISRPNDLTLVYYNDNFKYEDNKLTGMAARLFDQAYQFLDGINPTAIGLISDAQEDGSLYDLNEEELRELVEVYKKYIEVKSASLKSSIDSNESLQKEYKQLQFMESVINGKTQVVESDAEVEQRQRAQRVANASMAQKAKIDKQVKKADYINYVRKTSKKRRRSK